MVFTAKFSPFLLSLYLRSRLCSIKPMCFPRHTRDMPARFSLDSLLYGSRPSQLSQVVQSGHGMRMDSSWLDQRETVGPPDLADVLAEYHNLHWHVVEIQIYLWSSIYTYTYFSQVKFSRFILYHKKRKNYLFPLRKILAIHYVTLIISSLHKCWRACRSGSITTICLNSTEKYLCINLRTWPATVALYVLNSYCEQTSEDGTGWTCANFMMQSPIAKF